MSHFIAVSADCSRTDLVSQMAPLVHRIAGRVARGLPQHVRTGDLVSAGMVGLLEAAQRFEPARAESFVGYASLRIRGAILDELRRGDILSQDARMKSRLVAKAVAKLEAQLNQPPTTAQIAQALGVSEREYVEELEGLGEVRMVALDPSDESMVDDATTNPAEQAIFRQMTGRVATAMSSLPEKERLILSLYYDKELTYKEIGDVLDLTAARICQLHSQAVSRLRERLVSDQVA
jgi:RNA polymerase sigma factor for flagellar operon FliA